MEDTTNKATSRSIPVLFLLSAACLLFGLGLAVGRYKFFPYQMFSLAHSGLTELKTQMIGISGAGAVSDESLPHYYKRVDEPYRATIYTTAQAYPGLRLVTGVGDSLRLFAKVLNVGGQLVHSWDVDWWRTWPDPVHLPEGIAPRSRPGGLILGAAVMGNGDLVFNYTNLGMVRLDLDGRVVWRLPYRTHHSMNVSEDGNIWVCGVRRRMESDPRFPYRPVPYDENTVLEVSPQGEILREWSVPEILRRSGRLGVMQQPAEPYFELLDDRLHMNDAEPFPDALEEGFFGRGDVLVSLRNPSTIFVFNEDTESIKYISTGIFTRQHDPDFIDGDTFSVFDNNPGNPSDDGVLHSRILIISAPGDSTRVYYEGGADNPFFTGAQGAHQWLPNGNLLLTDAHYGRVFEVTREGEIVWEYVNYIDRGIVGLVSQAQGLPVDYSRFLRR